MPNPVNAAVSVVASNATTHDITIAVSAGTNRAVALWATQEDAGFAITGVAFDPTGANLSLTERVRRQHATATALVVTGYSVAIGDGVGAGSYVIRTTINATDGSGTLTLRAIQLADVTSGVPEDTDSSETTTASAALSNSLTVTDGAYVDAVAINSAAAPTWSWSGGTVTERDEQNETNYTTASADGTASGTSVTVTATASSTSTDKVLASMAWAPLAGPTIETQPGSQVGIISNGQSTVYTGTATGTTISAFTWEVDGTPIAGGGVYSIVTTGIGTGEASSTLTITRTDKTGTPFDINFDVTDANGTTASNTVTDTWWTGPVLTTFPATDGDGESTATLTSDFDTSANPGTALEVRIPLPDGDVVITLTTTAS
jgi:hypothetical protein